MAGAFFPLPRSNKAPSTSYSLLARDPLYCRRKSLAIKAKISPLFVAREVPKRLLSLSRWRISTSSRRGRRGRKRERMTRSLSSPKSISVRMARHFFKWKKQPFCDQLYTKVTSFTFPLWQMNPVLPPCSTETELRGRSPRCDRTCSPSSP